MTRPYPTLLVARPGEAGQHDRYSRYLLVAPGKHGADDLVAGFDGKQVRLQGQLIYREGGTMVEITPGSIAVIDTAPAVQEMTTDLGTVTVTGEIVDSKCYLGVMNPGQGKVHRDCAARCLSGGTTIRGELLQRGESRLLMIDAKALTHASSRTERAAQLPELQN